MATPGYVPSPTPSQGNRYLGVVPRSPVAALQQPTALSADEQKQIDRINRLAETRVSPALGEIQKAIDTMLAVAQTQRASNKITEIIGIIQKTLEDKKPFFVHAGKRRRTKKLRSTRRG